jgi:2-polyprenyl-3-methyl-5-hydroxy-6-metoxy-1,4-benzoquinol methylase
MAAPRKTKEKQYSELLDVKDKIGLATLGVMTNQVWHDDPRRLAFVLARYKFVSKMLSGRKKVAELGCGDAFGSRIVLQEVKELHVYDFDPLFIEDVNHRSSERWPLSAHVHDILDGPLKEGPFDAIYSLDVMEHIHESKEQIYLDNLKKSLAEHGALIVGMPSLESQEHASPQSKVGHINCKSGKALKAVMEKNFHSVFLFSMNDEVVHTGFAPMAHYLIALCCEARSN